MRRPPSRCEGCQALEVMTVERCSVFLRPTVGQSGYTRLRSTLLNHLLQRLEEVQEATVAEMEDGIVSLNWHFCGGWISPFLDFLCIGAPKTQFLKIFRNKIPQVPKGWNSRFDGILFCLRKQPGSSAPNRVLHCQY